MSAIRATYFKQQSKNIFTTVREMTRYYIITTTALLCNWWFDSSQWCFNLVIL